MKALRVYPNPSEDIVQLSMGNELVPSQILIYDLTGNLVFEDHSGATTISIGHLPAGSYLMSLITDHDIQTLKLLKK